MIKGRVSVLIPSRKERWLNQTLADVFGKAAGDVEAVVCHDGIWPDELPPENAKLIQFHPGRNVGMRAGINMAARIAQGEYLMKLDGHCQLGEGYDAILKADCAPNWVMIPRRYSIEVGTPEEPKWELRTDKVVDYHYLSYPFLRKNDIACGLHGNIWHERRKKRQDILVDREMSSQGSCYFGHRDFMEKAIFPLDDESFGTFASEMQEVGYRACSNGGQLMVNKNTYYGHVHKGKAWGTGYKFNTKEWENWQRQNKKGHDHAIIQLLSNRPLAEKLINEFWPVPEWPEKNGGCNWGKVYADFAEWKAETYGKEPPMSWLEKGA